MSVRAWLIRPPPHIIKHGTRRRKVCRLNKDRFEQEGQGRPKALRATRPVRGLVSLHSTRWTKTGKSLPEPMRTNQGRSRWRFECAG